LSTPFQNRLVGTIIVAAVAIIVLPDLLDGNKKTYQDEFEQIPPPPKVEFVKTTRNFPQDKIVNVTEEILSNDVALDDELSVADKDAKSKAEAQAVELETKRINDSKTKKDIEKKPIIIAPANILPEKSVLKQAWVVQLGSFRHKKNVAQLLLKLKDNGYTAFTKPIKTKNGTLIKVFIGPELVQNSLKKKIPALKKLTGVQGKIARFYPTK
jgi:DedD protein